MLFSRDGLRAGVGTPLLDENLPEGGGGDLKLQDAQTADHRLEDLLRVGPLFESELGLAVFDGSAPHVRQTIQKRAVALIPEINCVPAEGFANVIDVAGEADLPAADAHDIIRHPFA